MFRKALDGEKVRMSLGTVGKIVPPICNPGQLLPFASVLTVVALAGVFDDVRLALHVGIGAWLGMAIAAFVPGMAPGQVEIGEEDIAPIIALLASAPFISPIGGRVRAPGDSRSALFRSDRISIEETGGGRFALKARRRGLNPLPAEMGR